MTSSRNEAAHRAAMNWRAHSARRIALREAWRSPRLSLIATAITLALPTHRAFADSMAAAEASSSVAQATVSTGAAALAYSFDSKLLQGSSLGVSNIERFNKTNAVDPGRYLLDIYVNDSFLSRMDVEFRGMAGVVVAPCLDDAFLATLGVSPQSIRPAGGQVDAALGSGRVAETQGSAETSVSCVSFGERIEGAAATFDLSRLRLDLSIPQAFLRHEARGKVDISSLDAGQTMAYINYDMNYYTASVAGNKTDSFYGSINAGLNVGLWRMHQQSAYNRTSGGINGATTSRWNHIRTYAERPLASWGSQLTVGDSYTGGNLLSAVGFRGLHIETDDRMLPDSMLGYAPVVSGVAVTNARVVVSQNGNTIYQTTVAPGPFKITDLYPTSFQGDLNVQVFEANGQVSSFTVPFSAVPNSMSPGQSHYSATLGEVRHLQNVDAKFADVTYERGLTNAITANAGLRINSDYQSYLGGLVLGTQFGAFGVNAAYSNALDATGRRVQGWRGSTTYSHTIQPTQTSFSLAGYRYSTRGYRDFLDALGSREAYRSGQDWVSGTYQQRDQFTVNISQSFGALGSLSLSASVSNYYGPKARDTQAQLSYNNHYKSISYNVSFIRQYTGALYGNGLPGMIANDASTGPANIVGATSPMGQPGRLTNTIMATVTIPLDIGPRPVSLSGSFTHSGDQGSAYQASLSGVADQAQTLSYGVTASAQAQGSSGSFSANLQKRLPMITLGGNYSLGDGYWQSGANARGALVIHSGGVTFGPYVSDTFGIVEAKGAEGANVLNGLGSRVNRAGYALIPSLTPYRFNDVALDTAGINHNAELTGGQARVAPYAGSGVLLKFATRTGYAMLIQSTQADGKPLPLGADVLGDDGSIIGIVGQGGQVYARTPADLGVLTVKWGDQRDEQCAIRYDLSGQDLKQAIHNLNAGCTPES